MHRGAKLMLGIAAATLGVLIVAGLISERLFSTLVCPVLAIGVVSQIAVRLWYGAKR